MKKKMIRVLLTAIFSGVLLSACEPKNPERSDLSTREQTGEEETESLVVTEANTETGEAETGEAETTESETTEPETTEPDTTEAPPEMDNPDADITVAPSETENPEKAEAERQARIDSFSVQTDDAIYTYDRMEQDLLTLQKLYPDDLSVESQGVTADGRNLYACYVGNREAPGQIVIFGATHGREYMTTQLIMKQLETALKQADSGVYHGKTYREYLNQVCFVLMPMLNPDGVTISQLGLSGIRSQELQEKITEIYTSDVQYGYAAGSFEETLRLWKANANGVDLNRNFSTGWDQILEHPEPSSGKYKGVAPGSEPETQAQMQLLDSLSHPLMVISYHSYGSLVYWQYGQEEPLWTANEQLAEKISEMTGYYLAGYSNEAGFSNWCIRERGILSVTVETGSVNCPLPISQFPELWNSNRDMWWMLAANYGG